MRVNGDITLIGRHAVRIGDNVHIGAGAYFYADGGLTIGDNTHISRNLVIYTSGHDHGGTRLPYDESRTRNPVSIGRNVWIGMNVCIAPGSVIGDGAIVGLGTVVFGEVPPLAIIGASPWHQIGSRDPTHYERLDAARQYGGVNGRRL
ncbi:acyltransferase [Actinospongicola halichondriae]|uniref:acyltransferase n=1 Tax=Actinospongicola halichondriae TaxID=3236844 RepID=UPI003D5A43A8